ncbi:18525_t:CDS:2 [Gigaspora margarita]|uniref:18525_t:CDS:1 n=1 Tax=Gigaspora margarita TaxID=4874 RepID=A0ABM8VYI3_GIGMA|nr:18525_t:CDS:2 [Gigaspora margarita]
MAQTKEASSSQISNIIKNQIYSYTNILYLRMWNICKCGSACQCGTNCAHIKDINNTTNTTQQQFMNTQMKLPLVVLVIATMEVLVLVPVPKALVNVNFF